MQPARLLAAVVLSAHGTRESAIPFPLLFGGMWLLVTTLLALAAGHMKLLARFPPARERLEQTFRWSSGVVRGVRFGGGLHVGVGARGLHLAPGWILRPITHRAIPCIPWSEVRVVHAQRPAGRDANARSEFRIPAVQLRFVLYGEAGRAVERRCGSEPGSIGARRSLVRE